MSTSAASKRRLNALGGRTALAAGTLALALSMPAHAQQGGDEGAFTLEEVVVTGTYIKGRDQFNTPSPLKVIGGDDLANIGANTIADLTQTLTINAGSQNNPDAFTQNGTTGTTNFNLRGLGVASTLVLLNGRRQVVTGTLTNDGVTFVDTSSLVPEIAINRIEIVKDGSGPLYGSDAVAGVVNFLTDDQFEGVELSGRLQGVTDEGSQRDIKVQGKVGWQSSDGRHNIMAAASYLDRTELTTAERRLSRPQDDTSALGNPGSFIVPAVLGQLAAQADQLDAIGQTEAAAGLRALAQNNAPIIDPTGCESVGGIPQPVAEDIAGFDFGTCGFDFGDFFSLVPEEERFQAFATWSFDIDDDTTLRLEGGLALNEATRGNSPTFPFLQTGSAIVPSFHPANVFGSTAIFLGRASGVGGERSPSGTESDTYRFSAELTGPIYGDWTYDVGVTHAANNFTVSTEDVITDRFQQALFGFGGPNCDPSSSAPGTGNCQFFNPFATSFGPIPNDPAVLDHMIGTQVIDGNSELTVIDGVFSGSLFDLPAGAAQLALGFQVRDETFGRDYDEISNRDGFAFIIGNPDFSNDRAINAWFGELFLPLTNWADLTVALRHEDYGEIGNSTDPKISLLVRPTDDLQLRGSFATSFRAPSVFQVSGVGTVLNQVNDPVTGGTAFAAVRSALPESGMRDISPEQSEAFNFGVSWQGVPGLTVDVDYWRYDFTDVIIQENFQAVVNADPTGPDVIRTAAGTIGQVIVDFVNASQVETDGFDISVNYQLDTDYGTFNPFFEATHVMNYDLEDPQAGRIEGAGKRNFANFGTSTPQWQWNTGAGWTNGTHEARFFVRFIDSYEDDQNPGEKVASWTSLDLQYRLNLGGLSDSLEGTALTLGLINATDEDPPQVFTNGGFDSKIHDPRGRVGYVQLDLSF
ncbi:TonB-dependent receptor plug domain-containing protein [Yunchengibacter salinarum]|uniref:TonB-dependent receptor plug domain-containing protein n=1 Tax=Yunchengibacter salinarum TaxID=3133399 RepID=UPI0035B615AC